MEAFLRSIGVTDEVLQHLDKAVLDFQRPAVLWVGLALLIPVGYLIVTRQRENLNTVPRRYQWLLSGTRISVLLILIAVLAGPYLKVDLQITKRPIVAVLLDDSQSMELPAGPFTSDEEALDVGQATGQPIVEGKVEASAREALNRMTRETAARLSLERAEKTLLEPLREKHDVRFYRFARDITQTLLDSKEPHAADVPQPDATASHLGDAVQYVVEEAAGQQIAAIVLLSDGENTGGLSPSQAGREAATVRAPVFAVPVGSTQQVADVSIVDVYTSGQVAVGDTVAVHVTLESQGFQGQPVKVELKEGGEVLATRDAVVRDAEHTHVELTFKAEKPGPRYLTIQVPPAETEAEPLRANNIETALVRVSEEKVRVLLIDGLPRWDFRFLKNAIRRDNGLTGRIGETPDIVLETEWRRLPEEQRQAALPQNIDEWAEYHTVVVGDVSPELLTTASCELLGSAVRERGVGLIVAAGPQAMPHRFDEDWQALLPVRLRAGAAGSEAQVYNPFHIELSPDGLVHEALRLYDDASRNQEVWNRMPPYYWCATAEQPAPAATVLAWNPQLESRFGRTPLIAHHYAGDGKVLFLGTDSTWSWRQNVGDRYFYKFWGQAIRFVAKRETANSGHNWIEVRPHRAQPGEEAQIELMAFHADGSPVKTPTREVSVLAPDARSTITLQADPAKPGRYTGRFTPTATGVHRLAYQPAGAEPAEATVQVLTAPAEFRHPNVNRPLLESLASATGGEVIKLSELGSIPAKLQAETELKSLHREATVWDNWLTLVLLITVYSLDVGVRRLMGLV